MGKKKEHCGPPGTTCNDNFTVGKTSSLASEISYEKGRKFSILYSNQQNRHAHPTSVVSFVELACEQDPSGSLSDELQQIMKSVHFLCTCLLNDTQYMLSKRICSRVWRLAIFSIIRVISCANLMKRLSELLPQSNNF